MRDDLPSTMECRMAHEYHTSVNARGRVGGSEAGRGKGRREGDREERRGG